MNKELKDAILSHKQRTSSLTGWYKIDKDFATILLDLNVANYRNLDNARVNAYASDMLAGNWKKNGETIVVGRNGILQDGQNRLHAIKKSGVTIETLIVFDADNTGIYDVGKTRTITEICKAKQISAGTLENAIGRALLNFSRKESHSIGIALNFVEENIELIKTASSIVSASGNKARKAACGAIVYCMLKAHKISEIEMRTFFRVANSGNTVGCTKEASSALVLHKQLSEMKGGGSALQKIQLEITYRALNDFRLNNQRKVSYKCDTDDASRFIVETMTEYSTAA